MVDIEVVSIVCIVNSNGEMNRKVNFSGLVIFIGMVVKVVGISKFVIFIWFFGVVVKYIVKEMFMVLKIFELLCRVKLFFGNNDFSGLVFKLNFCRCCV